MPHLPALLMGMLMLANTSDAQMHNEQKYAKNVERVFYYVQDHGWAIKSSIPTRQFYFTFYEPGACGTKYIDVEASYASRQSFLALNFWGSPTEDGKLNTMYDLTTLVWEDSYGGIKATRLPTFKKDFLPSREVSGLLHACIDAIAQELPQ